MDFYCVASDYEEPENDEAFLGVLLEYPAADMSTDNED